MATFRIDELMLESKRLGKKITQKELAEAANVVPTTINKIIHGETQAPKPQILLVIAEVFSEALGREVTIDDLIDKKGYNAPSAPADIGRVDFGSRRKVEKEDYVWLPLYGEIPCGDLRQVGQEHIIDYLPLPKWLIGPAQFTLRATGESMMPSIQDGDLLLIEPGNQWENKNIVIAWVDGEVTCKRLQMNHSPALLVPDNRDYEVIQVSDETLILGRVVGRYESFIGGRRPERVS